MQISLSVHFQSPRALLTGAEQNYSGHNGTDLQRIGATKPDLQPITAARNVTELSDTSKAGMCLVCFQAGKTLQPGD